MKSTEIGAFGREIYFGNYPTDNPSIMGMIPERGELYLEL